jgi:glycosyltransferase involved in cell wall biosynthesis
LGAEATDAMSQAQTTVRKLLRSTDNDYQALGRWYEARAGQRLTGDPLAGQAPLPCSPPSVTVVIPAFNAADTVGLCLRAIEQSTFNQRYPSLLQVVVVDDGSDDATARVAGSYPSDVEKEIVQQRHAGRAHAMNAGIAAAAGDVIVSCDADMLLTCGTIEALVTRHQCVDGVLLVGFRSDIQHDSETPLTVESDLTDLLTRPALVGDNRLCFDWPGWPENMVEAADELRSLGRSRRLWMPSGEGWSLPRMVFGCLFSMRRVDLERIGGYDERFNGWGWEDSELAARAIAAGLYVVPVYAASGHHIAHPARSPFKWREAERNRRLYQQLLDQPTDSNDHRTEATSSNHDDLKRPLVHLVHPAPVDDIPGWFLRTDAEAIRTSRILAMVGRAHEALLILDSVGNDDADRVEAMLRAGFVRRMLGHFDRALETLRAAAALAGPTHVAGQTQLGLAEAAVGRFEIAQGVLRQALEVEPSDRLLRYILKCPTHRHLRRGRRYAEQGNHRLAVRDFEAALVQAPGERRALAAREASLATLAAA